LFDHFHQRRFSRKDTMLTPFRRNTLAIVIAVAPALAGAQSLQTGPDLVRAGQYLEQINRSDDSFDPNEIQLRGEAVNEAEIFEVPDREAIVDVRFTVKADGSVGDVELLGGFYDDEFRQQALDGIASTVFDPPKAGDAAVDWPNYRMRVIQRAPILPSVSPELAPELERVTALLLAKNYSEAEPLVNDLLATKAQTLFDYALLQDQLASLYVGTERPHEALMALRNATADSKAVPPPPQSDSRLVARADQYPNEFLIRELYLKALERKFAVAAALNQTGEAVSIAERLEALGSISPTVRDQADQIIAKLATEDPIGAQIKLVNGSWIYDVSTRRIFGMTGLTGQVDYVDIACGDNRRRRMPFTNDSEFALPASWEDCRLEFLGADGATFLLYEYLK
jgi:hypothetical protein